VTDLAAVPANNVVTGVLGFLVVAGMGMALFFLLRSMNKQLHKVVPGPKWRESGQDRQPGVAGQQAERDRRGAAGQQAERNRGDAAGPGRPGTDPPHMP
jgi:hypothetical protein